MEGLTPLHIAVHEGYSAFVEVLVGYGADINAATSDRGNTALHIVIARKNMRAPCVKTPQLLKVCRHWRVAYECVMGVAMVSHIQFINQAVLSDSNHNSIIIHPRP